MDSRLGFGILRRSTSHIHMLVRGNDDEGHGNDDAGHRNDERGSCSKYI